MPEHPSSPPGSERRREDRIPARIEVHFREESDAARALRAYSLNFSVGGLCLKTQRPYALGTKLKLVLQLGADLIELDGVVAWVRGGAVGIRFHNVPEHARARLEAVVLSLTRPARRD